MQLLKLLNLIILLLIPGIILSQNIVPNSSFEEYKDCPKKLVSEKQQYVSQWFQPTTGSLDYFNKCSWRNSDVPKNKMGYQQARTGSAYIGIYAYNPNYREFAAIKLTQAMEENMKYKVEFYVSLSEHSLFACENLGILFSTDSLYNGLSSFIYKYDTVIQKNGIIVEKLHYEADIRNPEGNMITDTKNWTKIEGEYTAKGGEIFLTIGNFYNDRNTVVKGVTSEHKAPLPASYYYIDDVMVRPVERISNIEKSKKAKKVKTKEHETSNYFFKKRELKIGDKIVLENIFFESNKSMLLEQSYDELNHLLRILKNNPRLTIKVSGYTDNKGSEELNNKLSKERAASVVEYLISKGIEKNRLKYEGKGSSSPIADNNTEEGRQKNRRVEFEILSR